MNRIAVSATALVLMFVAASASHAAVIVPAEGSTINYLHVKFRWEPFDFSFGSGGDAAYQLQVVEDNGSQDPFQGAPNVVFLFNVDPSEPRALVTDDLEWGKDYAWRTRAYEYDPYPWGPTHRFSTAELPEFAPDMIVTTPEDGGGAIEPGVTIFSLGGTGGGQGILYVGAESDGDVVWFLDWPAGTGNFRTVGSDLGQLDNGRMQLGGEGRGWETTLTGAVTWVSPFPTLYPDAQGPNELDNKVHHEVFPMPNGNKLCVIYTWQDVVRNSETQRWRSDRLVEYDRLTNEIVWDWNLFDHLSTLDFDEEVMSAPSNAGDYNWTHTNSVVYNELDNSVYISVRMLSRIVRIDYDTGDVIYHMGFDKPSGDATFGDNMFSFQHAPEPLPNGNLMVYDNGNRRDNINHTAETGTTKAIELSFTEEEGVPVDASIAWEFELPEYCHFVGDVDRQPGGTTLVTMGGASSNMNRSILEVDAAGNEIWRMQPDPDGGIIYRADRIAALYVDTPGDTDSDWDLDTRDYGNFQDCYTGDGPADLEFPCTLSDVDGDDDVDWADLETIVNERTGPAA